jgi:hypothetical protein
MSSAAPLIQFSVQFSRTARPICIIPNLDWGRETMRRWRQATRAACGAALLFALCGQAAPAASLCDEYDPAGPAGAARITLTANDFVDDSRDELRSFVATDSIGRVDVAVVSASPPGSVLGFWAAPQVSRFSPYYGEELKGIAVAVAVAPSRRPVQVVLDLRQVCAKRFRNTFLYY